MEQTDTLDIRKHYSMRLREFEIYIAISSFSGQNVLRIEGCLDGLSLSLMI